MASGSLPERLSYRMKRQWRRIPEEDEEEGEKSLESEPRNRKTVLYILLFTPICIAIGAVSLKLLCGIFFPEDAPSTASGKMETTKIWEDCGGTPDEARRRNCHFDILSMAWQTHECFDHANDAAFLAHHTDFNASDIHSDHAQDAEQEDKEVVTTAWKFFLDVEGQHEIPLSVALTGEHQLFVSQEFHFTHCTYMWRQMHRAYAKLGYIDAHLANWRHTLHCQNVLLAGMGDKDSLGAVGKVLYPKCIKVGDGSGAAGLVQAGPY
ncbi:uncharacterized protein yc1106_08653 [Curvularia clavata]|uniref:Uncharacterized protein n=1 Tax=Curvularia clavata TaxID=95742 RepID=A0A9Q8ZH45_CURCL|nr:uncharacterized protein yc1106_08653 [Curvularia clavata]